MRSPRSAFGSLVRKEARELSTSASWWVLAALVGPLVGVAFISAVNAYSEVSAGSGAGCGIVCTPLIGIWGPTLGAYEIAAVFLLPFVAIRAVAGDRQSGALVLESQRPLPPIVRVFAKAIVLLAGWTLTGFAALVAAGLWVAYGGQLYVPELAVAGAGHVVNGALTIALAMSIAAAVDHPSTAAIATLGVTIGTWILSFAAAIYGGVWSRLAAFTPTAMVGDFQHGLLQANTLVVVALLIGALLAIAAAWLRLYLPARQRMLRTTAIAAAAAMLAVGAATIRGSVDVSESRYNSFPEAAEETLERLASPIAIDVHLAIQDPRRSAFERGPLAKLRRVVPSLHVTYAARTSSGLYEAADPDYGLIRYTLDGRQATSYVVTDEGVLETVLGLVDHGPESGDGEGVPFAGQPLDASPRGAALTFYGLWPIATIGLGLFIRRRNR